jgi:uncharacterized protein
MQAVVDTNVLVSGLLSPGGPPAMVLTAIVEGRLRLVVCEAVLAEYHAVLQRPRLRLDPLRVEALLHLIDLTADWVPIPPYNGQPPLPDPADWPFIACALAAGCPVITGNGKHFPELTGVRVMTARGWLQAA